MGLQIHETDLQHPEQVPGDNRIGSRGASSGSQGERIRHESVRLRSLRGGRHFCTPRGRT